MSPSEVARQFNDLINEANLEGLASMMTDDHAFIVSAEAVVSGKHSSVSAWRSFFRAFPGYRNVFVRYVAAASVVAIEGHSECFDPRLAGPALWRAVVRGDCVAEWRVYEDTSENRLAIGL